MLKNSKTSSFGPEKSKIATQAKINTTARTNKHNREEMLKNSRKTHVVDQNFDTARTKTDPQKGLRAAGQPAGKNKDCNT